MAVRHNLQMHLGGSERARPCSGHCGIPEKEGDSSPRHGGARVWQLIGQGWAAVCGERLTSAWLAATTGAWKQALPQRAPTPPLLPGRMGQDDGLEWGHSWTVKRKTRLPKT